MSEDIEGAVVVAGVEGALRDSGLALIQEQVMDAERLFLVWIEDQSQTVRELSESTGIPEPFIRKVLRTGVFQERYVAETAKFRAVAESYTSGRALEIMDEVIQGLSEVVRHGSDRDKIAAGKALYDMIVPKNGHSAVVNNGTIDARVLQIAASGLHSMDDVRRLVSAQIDGNIMSVEEMRSSRRGATGGK